MRRMVEEECKSEKIKDDLRVTKEDRLRRGSRRRTGRCWSQSDEIVGFIFINGI